MSRRFTIAIEGCCHGELNKIYDTIEEIHNVHPEIERPKLLICCGDFQAIRPSPPFGHDMDSLSCPQHYKRSLPTDFGEYFTKKRNAPIPTLFIGGNHESSQLCYGELPYGGLVAPNIYYLGRAGVLRLGSSLENSLTIGGFSGIYKPYDYQKGITERFPINTKDNIKTVYHVREWDYYRLQSWHALASAHNSSLHIGLSHEWPAQVYQHGDFKQLVVRDQKKDHFLKDINEKHQLGCPIAWKLLQNFKPNYWFSAHFHCHFAATIKHDQTHKTHFLGLDKVLPNRKFLQYITLELPQEFTPQDSISLFHDPHWLATLKSTHNAMPIYDAKQTYRSPSIDINTLQESYDFVTNKFSNQQNYLRIDTNDFKEYKYNPYQCTTSNPELLKLVDMLELDLNVFKKLQILPRKPSRQWTNNNPETIPL